MDGPGYGKPVHQYGVDLSGITLPPLSPEELEQLGPLTGPAETGTFEGELQ